MPDYTPVQFVNLMERRAVDAHTFYARYAPRGSGSDHQDAKYEECQTAYCQQSRDLLALAQKALGPAPTPLDGASAHALEATLANLSTNVGRRWGEDERTHETLAARLDRLSSAHDALAVALRMERREDEETGEETYTSGLDALAMRVADMDALERSVREMRAELVVLRTAVAVSLANQP